ncbi:SWIM zinc finger family protein [Streptomyces varsoviensis]|uniref:SWIM zinc finger family protein n=1 Tax=Streptomyces varsoviensis TaxID=67373 RepID=UPI0004CBF647|nr:SWIM zinc finger family protein [Streptomyces varsoviensis]
MNPQGEFRTAEQVLALAPDAPSRKAGSKLATPGPWSDTGDGEGAVWGLCAGSGSTPYRTVVDLSGASGPAFNCSCPSRKFPCKHALGLLLLRASDEAAVRAGGEPPEWARSWLSGRRLRAERAAKAEPGAATAEGEAEAEAAGAAGAEAGRAAARRRADQRARRMADGARELEHRLADLLRAGLASADRGGYGQWEETAARMVDAQAPGLAARVRELAAVPASGDGWPSRMLAECALLHTLAQGFLHLDGLPEPLAATVRSRVGLTTDTAELLATGEPVRDDWLILAQRDADDGRLTTRRVWLHGRNTGRMALLLSYGAAGRAPELSLPVGLSLDADLVYYPAARPLRAALATRHAPPRAAAGPPPGTDVATALARYGDALRDDPWLDAWPVVLDDVIPAPDAELGWQLADARTESALPVDPRCADRTGLWQLAAVSGGEPVTVFGDCGHAGFTPLTTWAPEAVPL